jgi:hypothetical protein
MPSEVDRRDPLMVVASRDGLSGLQKSAGSIGEFLQVHGSPCICS